MSYAQGLRRRARPGGHDPMGGGYRTRSRVKALARCDGNARHDFPSLSCGIRRDAPDHGEKSELVGAGVAQPPLAFAPVQVLAQLGGARSGSWVMVAWRALAPLLVTADGLPRPHHCGIFTDTAQGRRSSVVERILGKDEVLSSILSDGTIYFNDLAAVCGRPLFCSKHIVSTKAVFRHPRPRSPECYIRGATVFDLTSMSALLVGAGSKVRRPGRPGRSWPSGTGWAPPPVGAWAAWVPPPHRTIK